ncbi:MAG: porin [Holosporales bacterium]|jgi:hypothetical protein|nr:porin [Holosporales bacterium]
MDGLRFLLYLRGIIPLILVCCAQAEDKEKLIDEAPVFKISGNAAFCFDVVGQTPTYYTGEDAKSTAKATTDSSTPRAVGGEAELVFTAMGKLNNGFNYGAKLTLEANKGSTGIDKMYLIFEKDYLGTLHAGNVKGPDSTMVYGGQRLLGGACGLDGNLPNDITMATGVISPTNMIGYSGKATKIVYYSPIIYGVQIGVSFAPDTKHVGHAARDWANGSSCNGNDSGLYTQGIDEKEKPSGTSNFSFGITHEYKINEDISTKLSFACVRESTRPIKTNCYYGAGDVSFTVTPTEVSLKQDLYKKEEIKLNDSFSYYISGTVTYKKFSVGLGYLDNGKSRAPVEATYTDKNDMFALGGFIISKDGNAGSCWNIGSKYAFNEKLEVSMVYHNMQRKITKSDKSQGHAVSFASDYIITSGLKLFGEISFINSETSDSACRMYNLTHSDKNAIKKQSATVFIVGAKITF